MTTVPSTTPDGKWIYFNSNRSGTWEIWRIPSGGGGPKDARAERITTDDPEDWFPHISPNGRWIVWLAFPKGTTGHNDKMEGVVLRAMPAPGDKIVPAKIETSDDLLRRPGHHQRELLVARLPAVRLRGLRAAAALGAC